jgi:hypothetical protein
MAGKKLSKSQLGSPSAFGGKKAKRTLNPWGNTRTQATTRGANDAGVSRGRVRRPRGSAVRMGVPNPQERAMAYPANDPLLWPIEDPATNGFNNRSGMTQAKADANNAALNHELQTKHLDTSYSLGTGG